MFWIVDRDGMPAKRKGMQVKWKIKQITKKKQMKQNSCESYDWKLFWINTEL